MSTETNQSNSILSEKVNRALQVRTDTPAMKAALDALTHLHQDQEANVDSRGVRVAIEKDALQQALLLQQELQNIVSHVSKLREDISTVTQIAKNVRDATYIDVVATNTITDTTTAADSTEAEGLQAEQQLAAELANAFHHRNASKKRLEAVHAFLEKFNLSQEDSRLLDHYDFDDIQASDSTPNGTAFLSALERVHKIRKELTKTFGSSSDALRDDINSEERKGLGASSALRMMENLAQKQERAYERLYHWLQKHLNLLNQSESDGDVLDEALQHPFVHAALRTLRNVPAFYVHTLELIANSRRTEQTRRFLIALTSGYGEMPPIEMKAHDPVAYAGDMLAFAFKAFSVESDLARNLIKNDIEEEKEETTSDIDLSIGSSANDMTPLGMLAISTSGIARPLKSRLVQVITTLGRRQEDDLESDDGLSVGEFGDIGVPGPLINLYEIIGLLLFYIATMRKSIEKYGDDSGSEDIAFVTTLLECLQEAVSSYEAAVRVHSATLGQLSASSGESEAHMISALVKAVLNVRKHSPGFSDDIACPDEFRNLVSVSWLTEILVETNLSNCTSLDDCVSMSEAIGIGVEAGMSDDLVEKLENAVLETKSSLVDVLIEKETENVLSLCGLANIVKAFREWKKLQSDSVLMVDFAGLSPTEVEMAMKDFQASLYSPPLPSLEATIKDRSLRKSSRSKIADSVCNIYEQFYKSAASSGQGGYEDVGFLSHTPEQVRTLFTS